MSSGTGMHLPLIQHTYPLQSSSLHGLASSPAPNTLQSFEPRKRKKPSQSRSDRIVKRAMSTPHLPRASGSSVATSSPESDKKRNKLGYHRTSVACGHCRRRKIRCLVPNDDTTGRCANCVRLKKECNFFPVEQPTSAERRPESTGKAESAAKKSSSLASPPILPRPDAFGASGDTFHAPPTGLSSSPAFLAPESHEGLGIYAPPKAEPNQAIVYSQHYNHPSTWEGYHHPTAPAQTNTQPSYPSRAQHWQSYDSPVHPPSAYSPHVQSTHPEGARAPAAHASSHSAQHEFGPWMGQSSRGVNFNHPELTQAVPYSQIPPDRHDGIPRRASTMPVTYPGGPVMVPLGSEPVPSPGLMHTTTMPMSNTSANSQPAQNYGWRQPRQPQWGHYETSSQEQYGAARTESYPEDNNWYATSTTSY